MIRYRLRELLADKAFNEGRTVTMEEVARDTGLHRMTLSRMANRKGYVTRTDVLDKLCTYFQCRLDQLAEFVVTPADADQRSPREVATHQ